MGNQYTIIGWILVITLLSSCVKKKDIRGKWYCNGIFVTKSGAWTETETKALKVLPDSVFFKENEYVEYYSSPATEVKTVDLEISGDLVIIDEEKYIIQDYTGSSFTLYQKKKRNCWGFTCYTETTMVFRDTPENSKMQTRNIYSNWVNIDYLNCLKTDLPCECGKSKEYF